MEIYRINYRTVEGEEHSLTTKGIEGVEANLLAMFSLGDTITLIEEVI